MPLAPLRTLRTAALSTILASAAIAAPAHAEIGDDWEPLYVGQKNHIAVGTGFGFNSNDGGSVIGLQPYVAGRVRLNDTWGVLATVPMMFSSVDADNGSSLSQFELGNVTLAAEYTLDELVSSFSRVRFGLALPVVSPSTSDFESALGTRFNVAMAAGASGLFDLWRFAPNTFSLFAEFQGEAHFDDVYMDVGAGLGLFIPTDDNVDFEMLLQLKARLGYGEDAIIFGGLGMAIIPTEIGIGIDNNDGDAFQLGLQAGGIFKIGKSRLDLWAQLNLDNPMGFSFSNEGIFGLHLNFMAPL